MQKTTETRNLQDKDLVRKYRSSHGTSKQLIGLILKILPTFQFWITTQGSLLSVSWTGWLLKRHKPHASHFFPNIIELRSLLLTKTCFVSSEFKDAMEEMGFHHITKVTFSPSIQYTCSPVFKKLAYWRPGDSTKTSPIHIAVEKHHLEPDCSHQWNYCIECRPCQTYQCIMLQEWM